jgi:nicotinamidase-related amidase
MYKALLLIDIQNDYFPGGKSELVEPEKALQAAETALQHFRENKLPVIHVQHINIRKGAAFFLPDTKGCQIHKRLTPLDDESVVVKHAPNGFYHTNLNAIIKEKRISKLFVCGMMTHLCIDTTVRAAKDYGIPITLLQDGCATKDLTFKGIHLPADTVQNVFLAGLNGMFAEIISMSELRL